MIFVKGPDMRIELTLDKTKKYPVFGDADTGTVAWIAKDKMDDYKFPDCEVALVMKLDDESAVFLQDGLISPEESVKNAPYLEVDVKLVPANC